MDKESKNEEQREGDQTNSSDTDSIKTVPPTLHKANASKETIDRLKETLISMSKEKESKLSDAIEKVSIPDPSPHDSLSFETRHILDDLTSRIAYWESVYLNTLSPEDKPPGKTQKHPRHLEIMGLLHQIEKELEDIGEDIDILGSDTQIKDLTSEVLPLFDLLEKEFINPGKKLNIKSTFSDSKTLDKSDLEKELKRYESLVSKKELEKTGTKKTKKKKKPISNEEDLLALTEPDDDEYPEEQKSLIIEAPPLSSTVLACTFDFTLVLGGVLLYMFYQYSALWEFITRLPETPHIEQLTPHLITFSIMLPSAWPSL